MEPNLSYIRQLVRDHDWSGSDFAREMGISRSEANRFLNGQRKGGNKVICGLKKAFPEESLETLFILPQVSPNVNASSNNATHGVSRVEPKANSSPIKKFPKALKPVHHPSSHQLACKYDESSGIIEIIESGRFVTTLLVPPGSIEVRHTTKPFNDTI